MDKKFLLDEKSFKALSAESRVNILKSLLQRRMTLSELSKKLSLRNSTIKEHCNLLLDAELVKKIDEGRKWKYYELTNKGKYILAPPMEQAKVLITLSMAAIIFAGIILIALQGTFIQSSAPLSFEDSTLIKNYSPSSEDGGLTGNELVTGMDINERETAIQVDQSITITGINYNLFSISVIFALVIGIFLGWAVGRKR